MNDEMTSPRVLAVVVTHNGRPWLEESLEAIATQVYPALEVIVVDNGSGDQVEPLVRRILPEAEFVRLDRNVGFGAAANRALEISSHAPDADYYLFLHDDVALEPECTSLLVAAALDTEAGIVGGKGLDWDNPELLVEVGMSADQFGYPFAGLEEGEIDQGQHDVRRDVLYVTNACALVSRAMIERSGSWDGGYFAFGEDLDLCIRARLSGFRVMVEPYARFRHAVAFARSRRNIKGARPIRFYTRRNRPRTIAKNVVAYRVPFLLAIYSVLALTEIAALVALRRFDELSSYPRAFLSFLASIPDVARRRRAVQKRKNQPDRRVRRYMVSDLHRVRVFAERRFRELEVGTIRLGTQALSKFAPSIIRARLGAWIRRRSTLAGSVVVAGTLFAARRVFFGEAVAAGSLWPFPSPTGRFIGDFLSAWRDIGLGSESAAPASFPLLWIIGTASFGDPRFAQSVLLLVLLGLGLAGTYRFISLRSEFWPSRVLAMGIYGLAPALGSFFSAGDLSALVLYAAAPWIFEIALRMTGSTPGHQTDRPATGLTREIMSRDAMRLALICTLAVALSPSSFIAILFAWFGLTVYVAVTGWDRRESLRRAAWAGAGVILVLLTTLPWSIEALRPRGAILGPLFSGLGGGSAYSSLWRGQAYLVPFFFDDSKQTLAALLPIAVALGSIVVAGPSRRRESRVLLTVWLLFAAISVGVVSGWLPAPVGSPGTWYAIPLFLMAAMGGHLIAGVREELPKFALGFKHLAAALALGAVAAGFIGSWAPRLASWERPRPTLAAGSSEEANSLLSFFTSSSETVGQFRILWIGADWIDPIRSGVIARQSVPYIVTEPSGLSMLDSISPPPAHGEERLGQTIDALVARRVHLAGHLLAPMSIRYIVVPEKDADLMAALGRQSDIALQQQQSGVAIFQNLNWLPRAVLAPSQIEQAAVRAEDDKALMMVDWSGGRPIPQRGQARFTSDVPRTRHGLALLGDNYNSSWTARINGERLKHERAFGWANRFEVPSDATGTIVIGFRRRWLRVVWLILQAFILVVVAAAARGRSAELRGLLR